MFKTKPKLPVKEEKTDFIYYKHKSTAQYPIFIRIASKELETKVASWLKPLHFVKMEPKEVKSIRFDSKGVKLLEIDQANPRLSKKLGMGGMAEEALGAESITTYGFQSIYRFRGFAAMSYSEHSTNWEMALIFSGNDEIDGPKMNMVLCRFMSLALASQGVLGFWAVPVDEGIVVMRPNKSKGEAIFVDVRKELLFTQDGEKKLTGHLQVIRLDGSLRDRSLMMRNDELYSFLSTHSTYLSMNGMPIEMRSNFLQLVEMSTGLVYPEDLFRPRDGLVI